MRRLCQVCPRESLERRDPAHPLERIKCKLIREANMIRPIALIATTVGLLPISAQAGIVCRDGYQVVNGQEISTPYCGDNYVAAIARKHGMKVGDAEVRNNPAAKAQVCRFISSDIEVREFLQFF